MQTFLPLPGFAESANVLDDARLGKQRLECKQILCALLANQPARKAAGRKYGKFYPNHPAVLMWRGYEAMLAQYAICVTLEWRSRGKKDTTLPWFGRVFRYLADRHGMVVPQWLDYCERTGLCSSHRAALLRKGMEDTTFAQWVAAGRPRSHEFPAKKSLWNWDTYDRYWFLYGQPPIEETHYGQFGWPELPAIPDEKGSLPYVWPEHKGNQGDD